MLPHLSSVHIARGGTLVSPCILHAVDRSIDDSTFQADLKILPLQHYNLIIGMDWLEQHSPMHVHWHHK